MATCWIAARDQPWIRENSDYTCSHCALHTATFLGHLENALNGEYETSLIQSYTAEEVCCFVIKDILGCKAGEVECPNEDVTRKWSFSIPPHEKEEFEFYKAATTKALIRLRFEEMEPKNIPAPQDQSIFRKQSLCPA